MTAIEEIKKRARMLASKTESNSITPEEVGNLIYDTADFANNVERNGGSLGIRKTYTSVSAMEADSTSPVDLWGNPMKKGNLCVIYDGTSTGSDNNKVFAFTDPGWQIATHLDAAYATREMVEDITGLDDYPVFSATKAYAAGDVVNYNGKLYRFTAKHAAGAWSGTDVEETDVVKSHIVQELGDSENAVMSQKATTDKFTELEETIEKTIVTITGEQTLTPVFSEGKYYDSDGQLQDAGDSYYTPEPIDISEYAYGGRLQITIDFPYGMSSQRCFVIKDKKDVVKIAINEYDLSRLPNSTWDVMIEDDYKYLYISKRGDTTITSATLSIPQGGLLNRVSSLEENTQKKKKYAHLSFDDTYSIFNNLFNGDYSSIWEHEVFAWLKKLHDNYGTTITLELFIDVFEISKDIFASEFAASTYWLKIGLHGSKSQNYDERTQGTEDWENLLTCGKTLCGSYDIIDRVPRLSNFAGTEEVCLQMKNSRFGLLGLLSADDNRNSYFLNSDESVYLKNHNSYLDSKTNIRFIPSRKRIESDNNLTDMYAAITSNVHRIEAFTHMDGTITNDGKKITNIDIANRIEQACRMLKDAEYTFYYMQNEIF